MTTTQTRNVLEWLGTHVLGLGGPARLAHALGLLDVRLPWVGVDPRAMEPDQYKEAIR